MALLARDIRRAEADYERSQGLSQTRPLALPSDERQLLSRERLRRLPPNIRFQWDEGRFRHSAVHFLPNTSQQPEKSTPLATSPELLQRLAARLPNHPDPSENTNLTAPEYFREPEGVLVKSLETAGPGTWNLEPEEPEQSAPRIWFLSSIWYNTEPGSITRQTRDEHTLCRETSWTEPQSLSQVTEIVTPSNRTEIRVANPQKPDDYELIVSQTRPQRTSNTPFPYTETCHYREGSEWTSRTGLWASNMWVNHYRHPTGERIIEYGEEKETP